MQILNHRSGLWGMRNNLPITEWPVTATAIAGVAGAYERPPDDHNHVEGQHSPRIVTEASVSRCLSMWLGGRRCNAAHYTSIEERPTARECFLVEAYRCNAPDGLPGDWAELFRLADHLHHSNHFAGILRVRIVEVELTADILVSVAVRLAQLERHLMDAGSHGDEGRLTVVPTE